MIKGALIHLRGLFDSDPNGQWCGARPHAQRLAAKHSLDLIPANWNDPGIREIVDRARAAGYYFVAIGGHSHGAGEAAAIAERYGPEGIDFLGLIDDCPPESIEHPLAPLETFFAPQDFPIAARFGYAVWQRNMQPRGDAFNPREGVYVEDMTERKTPRLGHIDAPLLGLVSIAGDARVWDGIDAQLAIARAARELAPPGVSGR